MKCSIVGYGSVSAAGVSRQSLDWNARSGRICWKRDPTTGRAIFPVDELVPNAKIQSFTAGRAVDRAGELALYAAEQAVLEAGWSGKDFSILVGCSRGPTSSWESSYHKFLEEGRPPIRTSPNTTLGSLAFVLADYFETSQLTTGLSVTCSSGSHAILHGMAMLLSGMTDRVLVGGTEAPLTSFTLRQMEALRVYSDHAGSTGYPCRPLDTPSTGMALGEGAAFLALERTRNDGGLHIYGLGFAREGQQSSTGMSAEGEALQAAMRRATEQMSGMPDAILAHAPGTKVGDGSELSAIKKVFGAELPTITSLKWATGHTFGASGPLAVTSALRMLELGEVWQLPYQSPKQLQGLPRKILVNATGFGGNAISILLGRSG